MNRSAGASEERLSSQSKCGDDLTVVSKSGVSESQAAGPEMFRARKEDGSRATKPLRELP